MKQMSSIQNQAQNAECDFTDAKLTGCGISFAARLAKKVNHALLIGI